MSRIIFMVVLISVVFPLPAASLMVPEGDLMEGVEPGPDGKIDVLTVFAHPDDESIYGGGTLIKIKKDPRVRLHILCLGRGDWPEQARQIGISSDHLVRIRAEELRNAAAVLQAEDVTHWTFYDRSFTSLDREKLTGDIVEVIERTGAEIVVTHDPAGITRNPDHLTCSSAATEAFGRSSAKRLYYPTLPGPIYSVAMFIFREESEGRQVEPAKPDFDVGIKEVKHLKRMACFAHVSQMFYSNVGPAVRIILLFPKEYWTLAGQKD